MLRQIVGMVQRGQEVDIFASPAEGQLEARHGDIDEFAILERVRSVDSFPPAFRIRPRTLRQVATLAVGSSATFLRWLNARSERLNKPLREPGCASYDIIHCHFGPNGQRAVRARCAGLLKGPIITSFHGYDVNLLPRFHGRRLYAKLFRQGDLFTVGSEFMRRQVVSLGGPNDRIEKLPMGVDLQRFPYVEKRFRGDCVRILTIARLIEVKGIEYLLRAVADVRKYFPGIRCIIAGDGPLRSKLEQLATELALGETIKFLGAVTQEQAHELYRASDVFVLPSIVTSDGQAEGQAVVLAEAQASGLPVIATDTGGIAESTRPDESALLVQQKTPQALADAMMWMLRHPSSWPAMGRAGRAYVEERFDARKLDDRLIDLYRITKQRYDRGTVPLTL